MKAEARMSSEDGMVDMEDFSDLWSRSAGAKPVPCSGPSSGAPCVMDLADVNLQLELYTLDIFLPLSMRLILLHSDSSREL